MKITKIQCPNCNGQLSVPEGMKEGFVQCKFCNTKVYLEPHKPDITQNITQQKHQLWSRVTLNFINILVIHR